MTANKSPKAPKMTAEQAREFTTFSIGNAATLSAACPDCEPYSDWFTYNRWAAQGFHVCKGQHGTRIAVVIETQKKDDKGESQPSKYCRSVPVFCRHQVAANEPEPASQGQPMSPAFSAINAEALAEALAA